MFWSSHVRVLQFLPRAQEPSRQARYGERHYQSHMITKGSSPKFWYVGLRLLTRLFLSLAAAALSMLCTSLAVVSVQVSIHGDQAFEHDAGANFALSLLSFGIALPVGILCFTVVFHRLCVGHWIPQL